MLFVYIFGIFLRFIVRCGIKNEKNIYKSNFMWYNNIYRSMQKRENECNHMDDNKNRSNPNGGGAQSQSRNSGKKNNWHKKKKRPPVNKTAEEEIAAAKIENADNTAKISHRNDQRDGVKTSGANSKKSGRSKGGKGRRPQIHDGFDDIRMNPHYVMVDRAENDEDEEYRASSVGDEVTNPGVTVGRNAVRELLRSGRSVDKIYVKNGSREGSVVVIVAEAVSRGIPIVEVDQNKLDKIAGGGNHQGVVAMASGKEYCGVDDILKIAAARGEKPLIVVSDGIEDPHNLGALIRCAECAGAHGIIIPKRRAVGITPVVAKCSAGAIEHMAVARVTNLASTLSELKKKGIWIFAAEAGGAAYYDADFDLPAAIVFGSEGDGVSRLVKERADFTVSIPMYGLVNSLNVSTAASVVLCHAARVRHGKA